MPIPLPPAPNMAANVLPAAPNDPPTMGDVERALEYRARVKQGHTAAPAPAWFAPAVAEAVAEALNNNVVIADMRNRLISIDRSTLMSINLQRNDGRDDLFEVVI
ncbi:hypothetical protein BJV77DRAFT_1064552 [Russula vinacea]|nr:hypothetical protein BJV77DRAFT_1064552 [Russula vinacea]